MSESPEQSEPEAAGSADAVPRIEINYDGLRSAITPINLMFDGRLYKDLKGLISHITYAAKKSSAARPDYKAALSEIDQLDLKFRSAMAEWEQKLAGEIQRLKTMVESQPGQSLGATKQINKYQGELNRGRASTRTMPNKTSQVRNQLIAAAGAGPLSDTAAGRADTVQSRLSKQDKKFPIVYDNCAKLIQKKARNRRPGSDTNNLARSVFANVSVPVRELGSAELHKGVLYYLHASPSGSDSEDPPRVPPHFAVVLGMNDSGNAYLFESLFPDTGTTFEVSVRDFDDLKVEYFEPLLNTPLVVTLLKAKFKDDDFVKTFGLYHTLRKTALENNRDEKFNPKQLAIHQYLTQDIFPFAGIEYEERRDEIRFIGEINRFLQSDL